MIQLLSARKARTPRHPGESMALRFVLVVMAGLVMCASASAATVYFCGKPDGTRGAQDHPCEDSATTLRAEPQYEPPLDRHQNIMLDGVRRTTEATNRSIHKIQCDAHKRSFEDEKERARLSTNPKIGARHVDNARASHDYLAENCPEY